jgi:hypothetical protein
MVRRLQRSRADQLEIARKVVRYLGKNPGNVDRVDSRDLIRCVDRFVCKQVFQKLLHAVNCRHINGRETDLAIIKSPIDA